MNCIEVEFVGWDQTAERPTEACGRRGFTGSGGAKTNKSKK